MLFAEDDEFTTKIAIVSSDANAKIVAGNEQEYPSQALIESLFLIPHFLSDRLGEILKEVKEIGRQGTHLS